MTRRQQIVAGVIVLVLLAAAVALWAANRRAALMRAMPAWLDPEQPPEGVAAAWGTLSEAQSWAANRATPMTACCAGRSAGSRVRRTYADTLAHDPGSFIRASFDLTGRC